MKKDYFRENISLDMGRKKVYKLKDGNIELLSPKDGSMVGFLEKGELIYKVNIVDENGEKMFVFRVMKYAGKKHQNTLFKAKKDLFEKYYTEDADGKSNIDGDKTPVDKSGDKKMNFGVPVVVGLGLGVLGYLIAKKYNKNVWLFGISGLAIGGTLGHIVVNKGLTKK